MSFFAHLSNIWNRWEKSLDAYINYKGWLGHL
jgi:hypothetical protein